MNKNCLTLKNYYTPNFPFSEKCVIKGKTKMKPLTIVLPLGENFSTDGKSLVHTGDCFAF